MAIGKVYLVGAGPGDPGLITLRAAEILARADAVLYDYLVNPAILRHCRPEAILISLGKHGGGRVWTQEEINDRLVALAQVCGNGRPAQERRSDGLRPRRRRARLPARSMAFAFEIVPGVTAALAAASYAGIPVTHRDAASAVALVTGQEDDDKTDSPLDYAALARFPGTLVMYMGVTTAGHWSTH